MTSPSRSPDPATNGKTSLSPSALGRFPHRLRYRAQTDHLRGGNVAILFSFASFASPRLYRQEQFRANQAAIGTNARASFVTRHRAPISTGPFGFVGELPTHLTQRGRGEGLRQPRADQPFQAEIFDPEAGVTPDHLRCGLVEKIQAPIADATVCPREPHGGSTPVHAALLLPGEAAIQNTDTLFGVLDPLRRNNSPAVFKRSDRPVIGIPLSNASINANGQRPGRTVVLWRCLKLDGDVPAVRFLPDGDRLGAEIDAVRQGEPANAQPSDLWQADAPRLEAAFARDEAKGVGTVVTALEPGEPLAVRGALEAVAQRPVELLDRHLGRAVRQSGELRVGLEKFRQLGRHLAIEDEFLLGPVAFDALAKKVVPEAAGLAAEAGDGVSFRLAAIELAFGGLKDVAHATSSSHWSLPC